MGVVSSAVAGMVAITPACGEINTLGAVITKAVDLTVGFRARDEYGSVPGEEVERAYDFRTAERLGALVSGREGAGDSGLVEQISRLLKSREGAE
ncbi:hypothetical protein ACVWXU_001853 [Streptomyces sp. TE33382]